MNAHNFSFVPLLIVVLLAFIVPILLGRFRKLGIPAVVGEILAGMLLGKSGFNLIREDHVLSILSILGFSLLMFLSGLEIDFTSLFDVNTKKRSGILARILSNPLIFGLILFVLTLGGAFITGLIVHRLDLVSEPWIITLVLSTTSLGVVVPVLKEHGLSGNPFGQRILSAALIADFVSILAISIYVLLRSQGLTLEILLILVLFAVFVAVHRLTALFQKHLPTEKILERLASPTSQIKLRGAIALALVFIALADSLGIENILGAFLAGVILSLASSGSTSALRHKLDGIGYGFFIPIFFVMVGVRFDLPALLESREAVILVPFMVLAAYLIKLIPSMLFRVFFSWRETFSAGFILSSRLSLIIAASAIGLELGVISPSLNSSIILVAIITCTFSPIAFSLLNKVKSENPDQVLIVGDHPMVDFLMQQFKHHGLVARNIRLKGLYELEQGQAGANELLPQQVLVNALRDNSIEKTNTVIVLADQQDENYRICRLALNYFNIENVISLVKDPVRNSKFRDLGVRVVNMIYSTALIIESMALSKDAFSVAADIDEMQEVREVKILNDSIHGKRIAQIDLPEATSILMLIRGSEMITPDAETILQKNDIITLVGEESLVDSALRLFTRNQK
ncbi:MAG: cation:proton antiporter [Candidatus Marinimicrobia bacterium]|nr:cation:proton antiporter [FCB group bacterium]MBL7025742.1 cation:proton antiporter [Candidatus Neomarinimicrobiota bacterium]